MGWPNFITGITPSAEYTVNQTLASSTEYALVDASNNNVKVTLGKASSNERTVHTIKKIDNSNHKVIIDAYSTETIDGEQTIELKLQYQYVTIVCDGTEWFIIGGEYVKMEDTLDDIKGTLEDLLEQQEKALVLQAKSLKHLEDFTEAEPDNEEIEEELRDMIVEVKD